MGHDILKCYAALDVEPGAPPDQIRRAYLQLAHVWDPARHIGNPPLRQQAERKRREIDDAYRALQVFLPELKKGFEEPSQEPPPVVPLPPPPPAEPTSYFMVSLVILAVLLLFGAAGYTLWLGLRAETPYKPPAPPAAPDALR